MRDIRSAEFGYQKEGYGAFLWAALAFGIAVALYFTIDHQVGSLVSSAMVVAMGLYLIIDRTISQGRSVVSFNAGGSEVRCSLGRHLPPEDVQAFVNSVFELKAAQDAPPPDARPERFAPR